METRKRWQLFLILGVLFLTLYNILPTLFFYAKPLHEPINAHKATAIAEQIAQRVNHLEDESVEWLHSFCRLIRVSPHSIEISPSHPETISVTFTTSKQADTFRQLLPRAGALIPFVPAQLAIAPSSQEDTTHKRVVVQRKVPLHMEASRLFEFSTKRDEKGNPTALYRALIEDRAMQLGMLLAGPSEAAWQFRTIAQNPEGGPHATELLTRFAEQLLHIVKAFGEQAPVVRRYIATIAQPPKEAEDKGEVSRIDLVQRFIHALMRGKDQVKLERIALESESKALQEQGKFLEASRRQRLELLHAREATFSELEGFVKAQQPLFVTSHKPHTWATLRAAVEAGGAASVQRIDLGVASPYIEAILIDWQKETLYLKPYDDVRATQSQDVQAILFNEMATLSRQADEKILPEGEQFVLVAEGLPNAKSFLAMRLSCIAEARIQQLQELLRLKWHPETPDLRYENYPIWDYESYLSLPAQERKLGLLVYAPALSHKAPPQGFHTNSIYVVAKGLDKILQKHATTNSSDTEEFFHDFTQLQELLTAYGFVGFSSQHTPLSDEFAEDFIFEGKDYFRDTLKATREAFAVHGTKRMAILEFSDTEQRMLIDNLVGTQIHEDLLRWRDDYNAAQLNIKGLAVRDVPKPTRSPLIDNLRLSLQKYFRGDDRKILRWGLDLSGGKSLQIELKDHNDQVVTAEAQIKQAITELQGRVNKLGVSEVSIRQEGSHITLDFPGSQNLSAAELVKSSSMSFHVVNEKFSAHNQTLSEAVNRFLQEVWNEALLTNRKEGMEIHEIACNHLYGVSLKGEPSSEAARILHQNGLQLAKLQESSQSGSSFNDSLSLVTRYKGDDITDWGGQTHPLLIVFRNWALEGSHLDSVYSGYDPSKGNYLSFTVKGPPRDDLHAWTSQFSKDRIAGTANALLSRGRGWRMAVVLNGLVVSAPTLDSPLRDSAMISGNFSGREIRQLEADLKAGSLSLTPKILSETNISPELGTKERRLGILATCLSLILVIGVMISYYRFAGLIASLAVLINLLIICATLQNLQAVLSLSSIAGIILTVGMAVDANVLVFERIREEMAQSGRLAVAIQTGYRKAFSAIIDSNLTTLIAGLILLSFNSGPIRGFALTLIIGLVSSMFTALFLTRYFFTGWVQRGQRKTLSMANFFGVQKFDFLKFARPAILISSVAILSGVILFATLRHTIFGMDFTGGYALTLELQPKGELSLRHEVERALIQQGAKPQEIQVRELSPTHHLRIFLAHSMQQPGRPFHHMPQADRRIAWVTDAMQHAALPLAPHASSTMAQSWNEISGQMSSSMRNAAIIGLLLSLLAILVYIALRFEWIYALSATLCTMHDLLFTLSFLALLHFLRVPVQIDLSTIAALLTIVGYSLNDTIIVFDRIREDVRLMKKASLPHIINHALNATLSRTVLTSGTTLLVLIPLICMGGTAIFGFALVMAIGVIFGTLSSLYVASPLMLYFHRRQLARSPLLTSTNE